MIKEHLLGILNAIVLKVGNGLAEGINSRIKAIKIRSHHGFRNKQRSANAIYVCSGGFDLYSEGAHHPRVLSQRLLRTFLRWYRPPNLTDLFWIKSAELLVPFPPRRFASEFAAYFQQCGQKLFCISPSRF